MEFIRVEKADQVTTVTLNRPRVMNAINPQMHAELQVAFDGAGIKRLAQSLAPLTSA